MKVTINEVLNIPHKGIVFLINPYDKVEIGQHIVHKNELYIVKKIEQSTGLDLVLKQAVVVKKVTDEDIVNAQKFLNKNYF